MEESVQTILIYQESSTFFMNFPNKSKILRENVVRRMGNMTFYGSLHLHDGEF